MSSPIRTQRRGHCSRFVPTRIERGSAQWHHDHSGRRPRQKTFSVSVHVKRPADQQSSPLIDLFDHTAKREQTWFLPLQADLSFPYLQLGHSYYTCIGRKQKRLVFSKAFSNVAVTYLHLENGKVPLYSANPWIESFAHTV